MRNEKYETEICDDVQSEDAIISVAKKVTYEKRNNSYVSLALCLTDMTQDKESSPSEESIDKSFNDVEFKKQTLLLVDQALDEPKENKEDTTKSLKSSDGGSPFTLDLRVWRQKYDNHGEVFELVLKLLVTHLLKTSKMVILQRLLEHIMCQPIYKTKTAGRGVAHDSNQTVSHVWHR
ncbi:unnamed protein product [Cochlearia groenlandica]